MTDPHPLYPNSRNIMKIQDFKTIASDFLKGLVGPWFPDKVLVKGLALTLIDANINKFDNLISLFADENGEIDIDALVNNLGDTLEKDMSFDLTEFSPYLPKRILIIGKDDIRGLIETMKKGTNN